MSYIGNGPEVNAFTIGVDRFNGTGACTEFTLTRDIDDAKAIEVIVNGVQQDPDNSYSVTNGLITFTEAPSSGTNNIVVTYRAPVVVTFNQVTSSQLQANSVTATAISPESITATKIYPGSVLGNKIGETAIRSNNIATGQITGNLLGTYSVSGNNLGLGSISANNFAGGGITSNVLASNLSISTVRLAETINVVTGGISGNYNVHVSNSTVYYFVANTLANVTFNLISNNGTATGTTGTLNDLISIGQSASVAVLLKQGSTRYRANVHIDGVLQVCYWLGNSQPLYQESQPQSIDSYNFVVVKTGSSAYTVLASNTAYSQANGQGVGGATQ